jgi:hypothetical protein
VVHLEAVSEQEMLGPHHVPVIVVGELHAQSVAGFAGLAVTDVVRKDYVVAAGIQQLARAEQNAGELV